MPSTTFISAVQNPSVPSKTLTSTNTSISSLIGSFLGPMNFSSCKPQKSDNVELIQKVIALKMNEQLHSRTLALLAHRTEKLVKNSRRTFHSGSLSSVLSLCSQSIKIQSEPSLSLSLIALLTNITLLNFQIENKVYTSVFLKFNLESFKKSQEQICTFELSWSKDLNMLKEKSVQSDDSWRERDIERFEEASTASASSRSVEIREDLNSLFIQSSSLEDFSEDFTIERPESNNDAGIEQNLPKRVSAKEMFQYYDGFEIDDLVITFEPYDHMLCLAKGPVQEKKAKNKCPLNGRRVYNNCHSPCSSPAYVKDPNTQHCANTFNNQRQHTSASKSNFIPCNATAPRKNSGNSCMSNGFSKYEANSNTSYGRQKWM